MRPLVLAFFMLVAAAGSPTAASANLDGTWSGDWNPKGGVPDSVTVQFSADEHGKLTGTFLSPVRVDFTHASYTPSSGAISFSAMDQKANKTYTLVGKVKGTEISGTLDVGGTSGSVRLIKWTYTGTSISN
jgi:hypothetical protein